MTQIVFWHWWVAGVGLLVLEAFAPGAIFLWLGISAGIVGLLLLLIPAMGWEAQLLVFSVLSIVTVVAWKKFVKHPPAPDDRPTLNRRGEGYIGRNFTLQEPIVNGFGKLRVDDTLWRISGPDLPTYSKVKVTGVDGTTLRVEAVAE
jgi:membrane protein implicated in regulation of membrane protease activity